MKLQISSVLQVASAEQTAQRAKFFEVNACVLESC
jgi:hypothetical protein